MTYKTFDKKRPLSWSAISSFEYDPEQWYKRYVLKLDEPASPEMQFGKVMGEKLANDAKFMPHVPRGTIYEYELKTKFGKIPLIGYIDSYSPCSYCEANEDHTVCEKSFLEEYKTGKKAWDQKRADEHGQITMYLLMLYLMHGVNPEDIQCRIHWLPTKDNNDFTIGFVDPGSCLTFPTKRSMVEVLTFGKRINKVYKLMEEYCKNHE